MKKIYILSSLLFFVLLTSCTTQKNEETIPQIPVQVEDNTMMKQTEDTMMQETS